MSAVMTGGTPVMGLGQNGVAHGNDRNAQLVTTLGHQPLIATWGGRWQIDPVWHCGDAVAVSKNTDQSLDAIIVRSDIFIRDWPVYAPTVGRIRLEVIGSKSQRNPRPNIGTTP